MKLHNSSCLKGAGQYFWGSGTVETNDKQEIQANLKSCCPIAQVYILAYALVFLLLSLYLIFLM
jgi:hypothetical protein